MSASPMTNTTPSRVARGYWRRSHCEFLPEEQFLNALRSERQRSERSGNSFLLALVHLNSPQRGDPLTKAVTQALRSMVRETDKAGWYQDNTVLGVMFTELRESARGNAQASIDGKLRQVLHATVPADTAELIRVSYHFFPESEGGAGDPVLYRDGTPGTGKAARILKRCLDVTGSLLLLAVLSPLLLLVALLVKLTSEGPVWHRQTRIGEGGRTFTFFKFRSMRHNSDPTLHRDYVTRMIAGQKVAHDHPSGAGIYKIVNDPRITPIGRVLRRSSLDELPQLFNVLKGDMSLIGPRPPLPYEFERYSTWHRPRVLEARHGITGLWQVHGRSRTNFDEAVRLDLQYLRQWSLWLDLKILLKTPAAVISGNGAY